MRRANGYHILSLILVCLGVAVGSGAVDASRSGRGLAAAAILLAAAGSALAGRRSDRRRWEGSLAMKQRTVSQLQVQVRELETRLAAVSLESQSTRSAVDHVIERISPVVAAFADAPGTERQPNDDLVRHLSHELRTPLTSIHACSELLLEGEPVDGPTRRDLVNIIHLESQRLAMFIDSALTRTRLESGLLPVRKDRLSLNELAARTVSGLLPLAEQREVTLELQPAAGTSDIVLADRELLEHALRSFLCEAIRQTPAGRPVEVRTVIVDPRNAVRLEVCRQSLRNDPKPVAHRLDRFYGGGEKLTECFAPDAAGIDLARRVIEVVHGGIALFHQSDDSLVIGFELPTAALPVRQRQAPERNDEVSHG